MPLISVSYVDSGGDPCVALSTSSFACVLSARSKAEPTKRSCRSSPAASAAVSVRCGRSSSRNGAAPRNRRKPSPAASSGSPTSNSPMAAGSSTATSPTPALRPTTLRRRRWRSCRSWVAARPIAPARTIRTPKSVDKGLTFLTSKQNKKTGAFSDERLRPGSLHDRCLRGVRSQQGSRPQEAGPGGDRPPRQHPAQRRRLALSTGPGRRHERHGLVRHGSRVGNPRRARRPSRHVPQSPEFHGRRPRRANRRLRATSAPSRRRR